MEELKVIMDALSTMGAEAKEAFIWWIIIRYLVLYVLTFIGCTFVVDLGAKLLHDVISEKQTIDDIAAAAGFTTPLLLRERKAIVKYIKDGKEAQYNGNLASEDGSV